MLFPQPRRDSANVEGTDKYTVGVGDYRHGGLWLENTHGATKKFIPDLGPFLLGDVLNTRRNPVQFSKDLWRAATPWKR